MTDIKFTDAAKYFKGEPHQIDAFEYLQKNTPLDIQKEFEKRFRTKQKVEKQKSSVLTSGIELIKQFEYCKLKAYYDPLSGGLPITIGWGSTQRKNGSRFMIGDVITRQEADDLLYYHLENAHLPILQKIPYWSEMNDEMRAALLSFSYNVGENFYGSNGFDSITRHLKAKLWNNVPDALMLYVNPGTNIEEGLRKRRIAEGKLWQTGLRKL